MAALMNHDEFRTARGNAVTSESDNQSPFTIAWVFARFPEAWCTSVAMREDPIAAGLVIGPDTPVRSEILGTPRIGVEYRAGLVSSLPCKLPQRSVASRRDFRTLTAHGDVQARPEPVAA